MANFPPGLWNSASHEPDCLAARYMRLPDRGHEHWPGRFGTRPDLCTCDAYPDAEAKRPDFAKDRRELLEHVESWEAYPGRRI